MYAPAARNAGGTLAPTTVIVSGALDNANGIAFDTHGDLWVANCGGGNLLEYSGAQLAAGGSQSPNATINGGARLLCPYSLAFDANGNVWVADDSLDHVVQYSAAQLTAGGSTTPVPVDTIGSNNGSLNHTTSLAFDAGGDLWVGNDSSPTVVEYAPGLLAAGGAPAPTAIITLPTGTDPYGLAFDMRGTLWVSDGANSTMYGLAASQLAATGAPAPSIVIGVGMTNFFEPQQPLFDPYATPALVSTAPQPLRSPKLPAARMRGGVRHRRHRAH
jgi:secreted PhoX family phosphatase